MGTLIFFFILYLIMKDDRRRSTIFKGIGILAGITALLSFLTVLAEIPGFVVILAIIIAFIVKKKKDEKKQKEENENPDLEKVKERWERQRAGGTPHYTSQSEYARQQASSLPKSIEKRRKIIADFNEKYNLTLTDEEMKRIVDASYVSDAWRKELESMNRSYEIIYEWFLGNTDWLRIYVQAFQIQTISSDFDLQKKIVNETFDEVMLYAESFDHLTLEERIRKVNEKYFACFDETSFMLAYRYMEEQGKSYDILKVDLLKNEDELERELEKAKAKYKLGQ